MSTAGSDLESEARYTSGVKQRMPLKTSNQHNQIATPVQQLQAAYKKSSKQDVHNMCCSDHLIRNDHNQ